MKRLWGSAGGSLACALVLLGAGVGRGQGEPRPRNDRAAPREAPRPPEEKTVSATGPSEEAVEVLKLKVRDFIKTYDTDGDGKLSWKELNAAFDAMGAKEDGLLDRNQLRAAALAVSEGKAGPEKPAGTRPAAGAANAAADQDEGERGLDQALIAFLREYDVNKDGKLSRDEVKAAFKAIDRDGDGFLDREELVRAGTRLLPPAKVTVTEEERPAPERPAAGTAERRAPEPDDRVGFWWEWFDKGQGGRISREEVRGTALESVFERIDVNRDGFLDREELRRAEKLLPAPEKKRPADRPTGRPADRPATRPSPDREPSRDREQPSRSTPPDRPPDRPGTDRPRPETPADRPATRPSPDREPSRDREQPSRGTPPDRPPDRR